MSLALLKDKPHHELNRRVEVSDAYTSRATP
jgi:hypothetical protein